MQRIESLYQHWSREAKKSTLTNHLYRKHKFEMINGFKQFSTCHVQTEILLPSAVHLEERLTVSQLVSYSNKQLAMQSVGQAGRQGSKQQHTGLGFF